MVKEYGKVVKMKFGPTRSFGIACPKLMEEIVRREDPIPTRDAPLPWLEYLQSQKLPGGLLTS